MRITIVSAVLGMLLVGIGGVRLAEARSGLCRGWIHETQLGGGVWTFHSLDCDEDPCAGPNPDCELVPVPNTGGVRWQCGCNGTLDGTCDATQVQHGGGTSALCSGTCNPGTCKEIKGVILWQEQGINHRLNDCKCQ